MVLYSTIIPANIYFIIEILSFLQKLKFEKEFIDKEKKNLIEINNIKSLQNLS